MLISPAINIGIGNYGSSCIDSLVKNFIKREDFYLKYVSFHQLNLADGVVTKNTFDYASKRFTDSENSDDSEGIDHDWLLGNFLSDAYNHLINLRQELNSTVNFGAIHINLIFSAYETEHLEILSQTILKIDKLKNQGVFGEVQVKCYAILSDGKALASAREERNIVKTLDTLVAIREDNNILSQIFIFDDKNTRAVSLGIQNNSLAFAITEIIVALLQNEYAMFGALHSKNGVFSVGLGMVYSDELYFKAFFKNRILQSKIFLEKIYQGEKKISTTEYREVVAKSLIPYFDKKIELEEVIGAIKETVAPEKFRNTILCYEFLLLNLLGRHNDLQLIEPIDKEELYSIPDMIYQSLYDQVLTDEDKAKNHLMEVRNHKRKAAEYEARFDDSSDIQSPALEELKDEIDKHEESVEEIVNHYSKTFFRRELSVRSNFPILEKQIRDIESSKTKLTDEFKRKNIFTKLFCSKKHRGSLDKIEEEINNHKILLDQEKQNHEAATKELKADLEELYKTKSDLEEKHRELILAKKDIFNLKIEYQKDFDALPYLDYEFLHNIICPKILAEYEEKHQAQLQGNIQEVLKILYLETKSTKISFQKLLDHKIKLQVDSILDFKMEQYVLNEYVGLDLFKPYHFVEDLERLKQRSYAFYNSTPIYKARSHSLKYFNNSDLDRTEKIKSLLSENYTASIPSFIRSESHHKFALFTIDMVEDLNGIVKYNNHSQRDIH